MDDFQPFTGKLDDTTAFTPFSGKLDDGSFKSGSAFKDTLDMLPSTDDLKATWEKFKSQWDNRQNTPMTPEIATKMMQDEHAAGSGILDTVGGLPAMAAGTVSGLYTGITNMDASKGLQAAGDTMNKYLPSTLLGNQADQQKEGYKGAMAPVTAAMDTLNAIPQGYGEILNAAGAPNAAAQVTDAGKLGVMAAATIGGIHEMAKGKADVVDHASKLEDQFVDAPKDLPLDPVIPPQATAAHADDFASTNPYDVGGHVTASDQGTPTTIDNPQGELFGGQQAEPPAASPSPNFNSLLHTPDDVLPYTKESTFGLDDGKTNTPQMGINMPEKDSQLSLVPKEDMSVPDLNQTKVYPQALEELQKNAATPDAPNSAMYDAMQQAQRNSAFKAVEQISDQQKQAHFDALQHVEIARRAGELDYQHLQDMGDKSLMPIDATHDMTDSLRSGDLGGAIKSIADNHPSSLIRDLAGYLTDKIDGINLTMHDEPILNHGDRQVTGYFDPNTSTVGLSGMGASSPHTVLHETVHALTSQFIQDRPNDVRTMGIKGLYNKVSNIDGMQKQFPGIVNVREFVAEAFSNPKFQEFLKGQTIDNRNIFQRFMDGVKTVMGIKPGTIATALDHAIDLGKQVIEASDVPTRQSIMDKFKSSGMPNKLADMMAKTPEKPTIETKQINGVKEAVSKIPGLSSPISDFTFYDKPIGDIIKMSQDMPDIPNTFMEKVGQQLQAGGLFESLKTRNPVVKFTYERITRAFQEAAHNVKENLTDPDKGLKAYMRALTPDQKGEIHAVMMLNEGQKVLSTSDLAARGFNEKQIAYYNKYRDLSDGFFSDLNTRRQEMGMEPMDARTAHVAGRFMGDFSRMVFADVPHPTTGKMETKVVGRISGSTKMELNRVSQFMQDQHPDWNFGSHEYNAIGRGKQAADRFGGLMEALNFVSKTDSDAGTLMQSYRDFMQKDAVNYLNATRHAKDKVTQAGGVIGSEGNKPWLDNVKNAEEGMKAQLSYFEQGYQWMSMEKAVGDLKPLLGDEGVVKQMPNAVQYATKYIDHSMGKNQGPVSDAANWTASMVGELTGVGHTNILKLNNNIKHLVMQKFMGLLNIPFSVTQLLQPLQVHPAMVTLLHGRGLEFNSAKAQVSATGTYMNAVLHGVDAGKLSEFDKSAVQYADQMGVFDVKMSDHTKDINASKYKDAYDTLADINITAPEHLTRGMSFLFYAHALKDAGIPSKDIFGAAENMTNMTMVNYHPIERPMGYAKLGWIGDVASSLTRYKHNQYSQLAFYAREGIRADNGIKSSVPMAAFLGTSLAFGGAMGFFAYNEADAAYQAFMEHVMKKPDNLTNRILKSNMPEVLSHGVFSTLGLDMTSRFSNANLLPDSPAQAIMPYGSAVMDMAQQTGKWALDPTNDFKAKQMVKSLAPQSAQGLLENKFFTNKTLDGKNLYVNSTDGPNLGKGRVVRSDGDMALRSVGFRDIRESKELAGNYANSQIAQGHAKIADGILEDVKYAALGNKLTPMKLQMSLKQAAQHGEDPSAFMGKLTSWSMDRNLSQQQQQMLQNAQKGFSGAFNIQQGKQ